MLFLKTTSILYYSSWHHYDSLLICSTFFFLRVKKHMAKQSCNLQRANVYLDLEVLYYFGISHYHHHHVVLQWEGRSWWRLKIWNTSTMHPIRWSNSIALLLACPASSYVVSAASATPVMSPQRTEAMEGVGRGIAPNWDWSEHQSRSGRHSRALWWGFGVDKESMEASEGNIGRENESP
jgi:hypothetical protein